MEFSAVTEWISKDFDSYSVNKNSNGGAISGELYSDNLKVNGLIRLSIFRPLGVSIP